jgi:PTH2 family peptidyl-tRNA hydrolase
MLNILISSFVNGSEWGVPNVLWYHLVTCSRHHSQTKVALKCDSEDELLLLQAKAKDLNLCARSIQDALVYTICTTDKHLTRFDSGRTQISAGSRTVLGIGPGLFPFTQPEVTKQQSTGPARLISQITGKLRLL